MANVTIQEFNELPDLNGNVMRPGFIEPVTISSASTHTFNDKTLYAIMSADADCRFRISLTGAAAVASGENLLSAIPNPVKLRNGVSRKATFA